MLSLVNNIQVTKGICLWSIMCYEVFYGEVFCNYLYISFFIKLLIYVIIDL